jgi:hypothetical protein
LLLFNRLTWLIVVVLIVGEVIGGVCGLGTSWWLDLGNKEGAMLTFLKVFCYMERLFGLRHQITHTSTLENRTKEVQT